MTDGAPYIRKSLGSCSSFRVVLINEKHQQRLVTPHQRETSTGRDRMIKILKKLEHSTHRATAISRKLA
jgi:hypothetical protein